MQPNKFSAWLEKQYIAWLAQASERRTQGEFAEWLGISDALLSHYLRGSRKPSGEFLEKLAEKLGDEAYDVLDYPRPDKLLRRLKANWQKLTPEEHSQIEAVVNKAERR